MKTWLVIASVVAVLLAASTGVGFWMVSGTNAELTSTLAELTSTQAELTSTQAELTDTEAELEDTKAELAECKEYGGAPTPTYTLSVSVSPSGAGVVSPLGGEYDPGAQVTLTANPASGYTFDYWSGSASGATSTITITMDSDKSLIANFETAVIEGISCYEAKNHIGERTTVYGAVVDTHYASGSSGKPTFLNMCYSYPDPNRFTVVIWGENRGKFSQPPEDYYDGKTIYVSGLIVSYDGVPQIEVTSPDQIHE